jgi:hypothetical protein
VVKAFFDTNILIYAATSDAKGLPIACAGIVNPFLESAL